MKGIRVIMVLALAGLLGGGCSLVEVPVTSRISTSMESVPRPYVLEPKTIMADDINITYLEAGEGPTVVLLHGGVIPMSYTQSIFMADSHITAFSFLTVLGLVTPLAQSALHSGAITTSETWNYNINELAKHFHVIAVDLPGFGGSDKPDMDYSLEDFVTYLDAFLNAKGISETMLVGHGLGGEIAIAYTLEHPEKVDRLALVDSFGAYGPSKYYERRSILNLPHFAVKYLQKEKAAKINIFFPLYSRMLGNWEAPKRQVMYLTLSPQADYDYKNQSGRLLLFREGTSGEFIETVTDFKLQQLTTEDIRKETHACHQAMIETRNKNIVERMPEVKVPVLIIRGNYDPVVRPEEASLMEAAFPQAQMINYTMSAHYPMVEEADRFNRDMVFFLSGEVVPPPEPTDEP